MFSTVISILSMKFQLFCLQKTMCTLQKGSFQKRFINAFISMAREWFGVWTVWARGTNMTPYKIRFNSLPHDTQREHELVLQVPFIRFPINEVKDLSNFYTVGRRLNKKLVDTRVESMMEEGLLCINSKPSHFNHFIPKLLLRTCDVFYVGRHNEKVCYPFSYQTFQHR